LGDGRQTGAAEAAFGTAAGEEFGGREVGLVALAAEAGHGIGVHGAEHLQPFA